ncbi:MAG: phospholipase D-like domain-containing protein [Terriglobales bacterium]
MQFGHSRHRIRTRTLVLAGLGGGAALLVGARALAAVTLSDLPYCLPHLPLGPVDSEEFLNFLAGITNAAVHRRTRVTVLTNGDQFYTRDLETMARARTSINLEAYEFLRGEIAGRFLDVLTERARAGVAVKLVVDAVGSWATPDREFARLRKAGGRVAWYNPLRLPTWPRLNNRTHRKLLTVDGTIAFVGGADVSDEWLKATPSGPRWRDTVFCLEGPAVAGVQSVFTENWLQASGEILCGPGQFPEHAITGDVTALVVTSTPVDGATRARALFQALLESARQAICITTPYFLPDKSACAALTRAAQRGVQVRILTAGDYSDHPMTRNLSRALVQPLLRAGAKVFEYAPSMIHAKILTVDHHWAVIGSTNFDHRSFALNDEINVALAGPALVARIEQDFENDLRDAVPLLVGRHRSMVERLEAPLSRLLEGEE